jgi:SAM-dependent methyltransferase
MSELSSGFETVEICPLCEASTLTTAFPPDVIQCRQCRVYFRSPRPSPAMIRAFYDEGSTYDAWTKEEEVRRFLWQKRLKILQRYLQSGRLLDVGTGDGHFAAVAREAGFEVEATEISERGATLSAQRGVKVQRGALEELHWPEGTFDVVSLWHVLEHVPRPGELLQRIGHLLRPGGYLVLAVPNEDAALFPFHCGQTREPNPLGPLDWGPGRELHLTHFQPKTLATGLRRAGFKVVRSGVDDVYVERGWENLTQYYFHRALNALTGWHYARALYMVARN